MKTYPYLNTNCSAGLKKGIKGEDSGATVLFTMATRREVMYIFGKEVKYMSDKGAKYIFVESNEEICEYLRRTVPMTNRSHPYPIDRDGDFLMFLKKKGTKF